MNKLIKFYTNSGKNLPVLSNYGSLYTLFKSVLIEGFNFSNVTKITFESTNILHITIDGGDSVIKYPINDVLKCSFYGFELLVIGHVDSTTIICEVMNYDNDVILIPQDYIDVTLKNAPLGFKMKFQNDTEYKLVFTPEQAGGLDYCLYDTYFGNTGGENGGAPTKRAIIFCSTNMTSENDNADDVHFPMPSDGSNKYKSNYMGGGGYLRNGISNIVYGANVEYTFIGNGNFFYFIVKNKMDITTDKPFMNNLEIVNGFGKVKSMYGDTSLNLFISSPSSTIDDNWGDCAVSRQHFTNSGYCSFNSFVQPLRSSLKTPCVLNDVSAAFSSGKFLNFSTLAEYSIAYESGCSYSNGPSIKVLGENKNKYSITRSLLCSTDVAISSFTKVGYMPFMYYFTENYANTPNYTLLRKDNRIFYTTNSIGYSSSNVQFNSRFLIEITPKGYNNYD